MPTSDGYNNCFMPWPDMGQAIRVYAEDGPSPTLSTHHVLVLHGVTVDGTDKVYRRQNFGTYVESDHTQALLARDYKEGVDLVVQPTWWDGEETAPTLTAKGSDQRMPDKGQLFAVIQAVPIQDGRGMEKSQNGLGVGEPGDPMYTLDTTGAQAVGYVIQTENGEPVIPFKVSHTKSNGSNVGEAGDPMYTLDTSGSMGVGYVLCFDGKRNDDFRMFEDYYPTLTQMMGTGGNNVPMIIHDIPKAGE